MRQVWTYRARDRVGQSIVGEVEGDSADQVRQSISERGLIPTKIKKRPDKVTLSAVLGNFGSANREHLIIFTKKLRTLYRAGIPLLRALAIIERGGAELRLAHELQGIRGDMQAGVSLSNALARYPKRFPPIYTSSIAAGETSGKLDEVLEQLSELVEKEMVIARQVKAAVRYPALVIIAISIAVTVLMLFVIPRFAEIYGKFGAALPLPTKIVMGASRIFKSYWFVAAALLTIGAVGLRRFIATDRGRLKWDRMMTHIPVVGSLIIKANIARFASMLRILFQSGVPMVTSLNILEETTPNKAIAMEIGQMAESFERGREIGHDRENYRYIPDMALEMLEIGLESGSVEMVMAELASHYEMELEYKSRHLTALLEPILTVLIGAMVLVLALAIFLPMWNLIQVFR